MSEELHIYYDEEADFLEIDKGPFTSTHCRDLSEGVYERIDDSTGEIKGIGILSFKKRSQKNKEIGVKLPFKLAITHS